MNLISTWTGITPTGVDQKVSTHNTDSSAHLNIQKNLDKLEQDVVKLKLQNSQVTENAFTVTFENLDAIDSSQIGVWNEAAQRIEF